MGGKDKLDKKRLKAETKLLQSRLSAQQQLIKEAKLPVLILFEGWSSSGKGGLINQVIQELDPRFFDVKTVQFVAEDKERYPFLYRYFNAIPENGQIQILNSGWMEEAVSEMLARDVTEQGYEQRIESINRFERQLRDGGYIVIKLFLDVSRSEQRRRMARLLDDHDTSWRITKHDIWQQEHYDEFREAYYGFMEATEKISPWHVLDAENRRTCRHKALSIITSAIDTALSEGKYCGKPFDEEFELLKMPKLKDVDLSAVISDEDYDKELKKLQERLSKLHNQIYRKRIPVVICYEGWDAAGKGGNIRRVSQALDPRGYEVQPIASPEPHELARHYLWRFWQRLPRTGHVTIFDRTWYGRVMVERIEGYCGKRDWKRAYNEINEFERELTDWGAVVLKFWIHINPETQLERFNARQNTPSKQWKITEEDWRNRDKWSDYEAAVDEMLEKTSTVNAPWYIIESVDKKYARIKALRIIAEAMETALASNMMRGMSYEWKKEKKSKVVPQQPETQTFPEQPESEIQTEQQPEITPEQQPEQSPEIAPEQQ